MSHLNKLLARISPFLVVLLVMTGCVQSAYREINARDINMNMTHQGVMMWGTVVEIFPDNDNPSFGTFIIKDQLGDTIRVRTTKLPRFGQAMTVRGTVYESAGQFYILQSKTTTIPIELIVAGSAFIAFVILIITLLAYKPKKRQLDSSTLTHSDNGYIGQEPRSVGRLDATVDYPIHTADYYGTIEVIEGDDKGKRFDISKDVITIGRDPSLEVVLSSPAISRKQAQVRVKANGDLEIVNLGKTMYFQGKETAAHKISNQDVVQFAGTHLKFHLIS